MSPSAKDKRWAIVPPSSATSDAVSESLRIGAEQASPVTLRSRPTGDVPRSGERLRTGSPFETEPGTVHRDWRETDDQGTPAGGTLRAEADAPVAVNLGDPAPPAAPTIREPSLRSGAPQGARSPSPEEASLQVDPRPGEYVRFDTQVSRYRRDSAGNAPASGEGLPSSGLTLGRSTASDARSTASNTRSTANNTHSTASDSSREDIETIPAPPWLEELDEPGVGLSEPSNSRRSRGADSPRSQARAPKQTSSKKPL